MQYRSQAMAAAHLAYGNPHSTPPAGPTAHWTGTTPQLPHEPTPNRHHTRRQLQIWQQNTNRSLEAQLDLLHSLTPTDFDIATIQEPHVDFLGNSRATPHWISTYPSNHCDNPKATRSLILVNKTLVSTNAWTQIPIDSLDITALRLESNLGTIYFYNIYNDSTHSRNLQTLETHLRSLKRDTPVNGESHMIWLGNFNRHHPLWDEERNAHLFTSANLDAAQPLLNLLAAHDMKMALPKDIPTLEAMKMKNYTRPDNVFCTSELMDAVLNCNTKPEARPPPPPVQTTSQSSAHSTPNYPSALPPHAPTTEARTGRHSVSTSRPS
jgi:Endonuclease-reverse transcriptase